MTRDLLDAALKAAEAQTFDLKQLNYTAHGVSGGTK
jgi:hypothetical protein